MTTPAPVPIPSDVRAVLESGALAHLATTNADGSPQVTIVWVGIEDDEVVCGSLGARRKLANIERDGRVAVSLETDHTNPMGLREYLVVYGDARITEGGAPELLQRLAETYIGPGVKFPPMDDPPPGFVVRIRPTRYAGVGPWA
jgi:PPOX class probable F420-dependent enzyme